MRGLAHGVTIVDGPMNAENLHTLRVAVKRLHYALDFFYALSDHQARAMARRRLATVQDHLGRINDSVCAQRLLAQCAREDPGLRRPVAMVQAWLVPRQQRLLRHLNRKLARLNAVDWHAIIGG